VLAIARIGFHREAADFILKSIYFNPGARAWLS
jgi:hypothetical protein